MTVGAINPFAVYGIRAKPYSRAYNITRVTRNPQKSAMPVLMRKRAREDRPVRPFRNAALRYYFDADSGFIFME